MLNYWNTARGGIIGLCACYRAARGFVHFIDSTHVESLAPVRLDLLDQISIRIIQELRNSHLPDLLSKSQVVPRGPHAERRSCFLFIRVHVLQIFSDRSEILEYVTGLVW
jgi:hypothetical protein